MKRGDLFVAVPGSKADGAVVRAAGARGRRRRGDRPSASPEHLPDGIAFVRAGNVRRALALAAARFYPRQPSVIAAVTGTSGKTSVAAFTRQIWAALGHRGGEHRHHRPGHAEGGDLRLAHHARSDRAARARSTGWRATASRISRWRPPRTGSTSIASTACASPPAASPILSRDHMDYHATRGGLSRRQADPVRAHRGAGRRRGHRRRITSMRERVVAAARKRGLARAHGRPQGDGIRLIEMPDRRLLADARARACGRQVLSRAAAAGRRIPGRERAGRGRAGDRDGQRSGCGVPRARRSAKARRAGSSWSAQRNGAPIFVDYAHKPDALAKALDALRPYAKRKLVVVFGAGGDRDAGQAAADGRDRRREGRRASSSPTTIRAARIPPRSAPRSWPPRPAPPRSATAARRSARAVAALQPGDVLLDRRQGPRNRPDRRRRVLPFSDHEAVAAALQGEGRMSEPLWTVDAMAAAMGAQREGALPAGVSGISIDSRTHRAGRGVLRHQGRNRDGHEFVAAALQAGAGACGRRRTTSCRRCRRTRRCSSCPTCSRRLRELGRAARARSPAKVIARHRLGRQDRHQGGAAARARRATARPTPRPPPTTITGACRCRSRACPQTRALRHLRDRHEPCRRDRAAGQAGAAACRDHHHDRAGASGILRLARGDRRRQGGDLSRASSRAAPRSSIATIRSSRACASGRAGAGVDRIVSFGEHARRRRAARSKSRCKPTAPTVQASILGARGDLQARRAGPACGADNSLAVLAAAPLAGADLALAALALADADAAGGRGAAHRARAARRHSAADRRELQRQSGLDARGAGAARPGAGRPARAGASPCSATCSSSARMAPMLHRGLADAGHRQKRSISCSAAGPLMQALVGSASLRAPGRLCGRHPRRSKPTCCACGRAGRCRHGQGLARLAHGPDRQGADTASIPCTARATARRALKVDPMLYWLADLRRQDLGLQRLPLHHLPHRRRDDHGGAVRVPVRPGDHRLAAAAAGQGPADPRRRAADRISQQGRHADHGRADDPVAASSVSTLLWANLPTPMSGWCCCVTLGFGAIGFYDDYLKVTKQIASRLFRQGAAGRSNSSIAGIAAWVHHAHSARRRSRRRWRFRSSRI